MSQDPKAKYEFLDQLSHAGADSADIVYQVRNRKTNQSYACKRISKHQTDYAGSCLRYTCLSTSQLAISWFIAPHHGGFP